MGYGEGDFSFRVKSFYLFNRYRRPINRKQAVAALIFSKASSASIRLQRKVGIDRSRHFNLEIKKGSDWFSVTHDLALYLLRKKKTIRQLFRFADIPTEFYVQTLIWNSKFRSQVLA